MRTDHRGKVRSWGRVRRPQRRGLEVTVTAQGVNSGGRKECFLMDWMWRLRERRVRMNLRFWPEQLEGQSCHQLSWEKLWQRGSQLLHLRCL